MQSLVFQCRAAAPGGVLRWPVQCLLGLGVLWLGAAGAWAGTAEVLAKPALVPGQEIRIDDPATGGLGYWTLYLPPNYSDQRAWPVIFSFHPLDAEPSAWPFDQVTQRKDYIIVGMEYLQRGLEGINRAEEAVNLERVLDIVSQWLSIDARERLIGGFSKGGWHASQVSERTAELWAGVVILGAGRSASPDASGLRGKPIFIGIGEHDSQRGSAVAAADFYQQLGASVTFVTFQGRGHNVDTEDATFKQWLASRIGDNPTIRLSCSSESPSGSCGGSSGSSPLNHASTVRASGTSPDGLGFYPR